MFAQDGIREREREKHPASKETSVKRGRKIELKLLCGKTFCLLGIEPGSATPKPRIMSYLASPSDT